MKDKMLDLLTAISILLIGVAFLGEALGIWNVRLFAGWWTLFLIIPALINVFKNGFKVLNTITLFIGVALLLRAQGVFENINTILLVFSVLLIAIGCNKVYEIIKNSRKKED